MSASSSRREGTTRGFARTSSLLQSRVRDASASRGFSQSRLLTRWSEIVGSDVAEICRPVEVSYKRGGFGATLVVLTTGANAPMLEMEKEKLRARVNSVYGYNAIARIRLTQTAPQGFAEGQADFLGPEKAQQENQPSQAAQDRAAKAAEAVANDDLRAALERLGTKIMSQSDTQK